MCQFPPPAAPPRVALSFLDVDGQRRQLLVWLKSGHLCVESGPFLDCLVAVAAALRVPYAEVLRQPRYNTVEGLHRFLAGAGGPPAGPPAPRVPLNERRYLSDPARAVAMRARLVASLARGYLSLPPDAPEAARLAALLDGHPAPGPASPERAPSPPPAPKRSRGASAPDAWAGGPWPSSGDELESPPPPPPPPPPDAPRAALHCGLSAAWPAPPFRPGPQPFPLGF